MRSTFWYKLLQEVDQISLITINFFITVLLAVCNASYDFTLVDIGEVGRQSDDDVYSNSKLGQTIDQNILKFPEPAAIDNYNTTKKFPYAFVADEAFALKPFMLRPYPKRNDLNINKLIFNYRLSAARKLIENTFGSRFRIFRGPIIWKIENIKHITKAAVILHNFPMKKRKGALIAHSTMSTKKQCKEYCLYVDWLKLMSSSVLLDWEYKDQIISLELQRKCAMILKTSRRSEIAKWCCPK